MFDYLLKNDFKKNIDIVNTTNKILVDRIPTSIAFTYILLNQNNKNEVQKILLLIEKQEKRNVQKLTLKRKKPYIIALNSILTNQLEGYTVN